MWTNRANKKRAMRSTCQTIKFLAAFPVLLCLISILFVPAAYAAGSVEVTLTMNQLLNAYGSFEPPSDLFSYQLKAATPGTPMPEGSSAESYIFELAGSRDTQIGSISFDTTGIYTYTLRCLTSDMPGYKIDRRNYTIEVYVLENLEAAVLVYLNGDKVLNQVFEHTYGTLPNNPTGDGSGGGGSSGDGGSGGGSSSSGSGTTNRPDPPSGGDIDEATDNPNLPGSGNNKGETTESSNSPESNDENGKDGETTGKPNPPSDSPKTGDFSNPILWITLIASSAVLLVSIVLIELRSRRLNQQTGRRKR